MIMERVRQWWESFRIGRGRRLAVDFLHKSDIIAPKDVI